MSWFSGFYGSNNNNNNNIPAIPVQPKAPETIAQESKDEKSKMDQFRFNADAYEKAAKCAKDVDNSSFSKEVLEHVTLQEMAKTANYNLKLKEIQKQSRDSELYKLQLEREHRQQMLSEEEKIKMELSQYSDQLARKRYDEQLTIQHQANEQNLLSQKESLAKQEALRRETIDYEMLLRSKLEAKQISEESKIKAKVERDNQDLILQRVMLEANEARITVQESISSISSLVGNGMKHFLDNRDQIIRMGGFLTLTGLGLYTAKRGTSLLATYVESQLFKPILVKETSRFTIGEALKNPVAMAKRYTKPATDAMKGIILEPKLENRLRQIAVATRNSMKHSGAHQNLLMHGPPGTGKTLFAKKLAFYSGMDYAVISGGALMPLEQQGPAAINELFRWANTSRRGLMLFIDEAESFLFDRTKITLSKEMLATLSTFLAKSGTPSKKFKLVLATNTPQLLDKAVYDRVNLKLKFDLPGVEERERLIRHYFDELILQLVTENRKLKIDNFDYSKLCSDIAKKTDGLSGRDIYKMVLNWQINVMASEEGKLTEEIMLDGLNAWLKAYENRNEWARQRALKQDTNID